MMDSFELLSSKIEAENAPAKYGLENQDYGVVTLHRPSNVDNPEILKILIDGLVENSKKIKLIFAIHPRTRKNLEQHGLWEDFQKHENLVLIDPVSYVPFMSLVRSAKIIITDSGGIQEESTYLDIPCLTLRDNTERPITITEGTNKLVKPHDLSDNVDLVLSGDWIHGTKPKNWDGHTAERITKIIKNLFDE